MRQSIMRWGSVLLASLAIAGCGGGGGGGGTTSTPSTPVATAITTAAAVSANDSSTNVSSSFAVLQNAGVAAVSIASPPVVNFTVFSDGAVVQGLKLANVRVALAKLIPGSNGDADEWVSYVTRTKTATTGLGLTSLQATTDSTGTLTYNSDGYYTYTFKTDVKQTKNSAGALVYDVTKTHRVVLQLSYTNKAGATVKVNPYFDFKLSTDGSGKATSVTATAAETRKMTDVNSCNSCHEKLALHGGGRVDTQFCVMCHNPGTTDPVTGNVVSLSTMAHNIHAGKRVAVDGAPYIIGTDDYSEVGFPQDLRNCSKCHAATASTPQGDNWKTVVTQGACLTCHVGKTGGTWETNHKVYANTLVGSGAAAKDLTSAQCASCHKAGSNIASETVHWNQNEENAAKYKMNIESVAITTAPTLTVPGVVTVKYYLSDPTNNNAAYDLKAGSDPTKFTKLNFMLGYAKTKGQSTSVTEFTNAGSEKVLANVGTDLGGFHYTADIPVAKLTSISDFVGTVRVVSYGQIIEPLQMIKSVAHEVVTPIVLANRVNTLVQHTYADVAITGTLQPRRDIVSNDKCNACHGSLGATSGANELVNAFHGGARNTVEACAVCHDANRASSGNMMANTSPLYESFQFKRMIHGIHGNSKRVNPFTHGNKVVGNFGKDGALTTTGYVFDDQYYSPTSSTKKRYFTAGGSIGTVADTFSSLADILNNAAISAGFVPTTNTPRAASAAENYAAEVAYPGVGLNCNACHVNNSYKNDLGPLGTVVMKTKTTTATDTVPATLDTDPNGWFVISPKASSCTSCHDSSAATAHVTSFGGAAFGNKTQAEIAALPRETCNDCHASGSFKGVDIVHGQK